MCWAQGRLSPSSAIARTTYPGGRGPVPPRRRAQGLTSGLLWPPGALAFRATLQLLTPPPRLPSSSLASSSPRAGTLSPPSRALGPLPLSRSGLGYPEGDNPLFPAPSPPPLQPRLPHSSSLCLPPPPRPPPLTPPTAATSWFEGANGRAPPGVSYLHHVGEGERGGQVEPHPNTERLSAIARASRGCSWAPRLFFIDAPAIGYRKGRPAAPSFHPPSCPGCGAPARCGLGWLVTAFCPGGREEGGGRFLFLLEEAFSTGFLVLTSNPTSPPPEPPPPPPHLSS